MDGISLAMPAATIANPGSSIGDAGALDARGEAAAADFATLLAAGLLPQQDLSALMPAAVVPAQAPDPAAELGLAETLIGADAPTLAGAAAALHPGVMAQARAASQDAALEASTAAAQALLPAGEAKNTPSTPVAADAATLAAEAAGAAAAAGSAERGTLALELQPVAEAPEAAASDPSALATHPLHSAAAEKLPAAQPTALLEVAAPVESREFAQALSQQVVWMADKDAQVAELRINPPELGPVEVRLKLSGDEATVQFASAHAEVRNAIEAAVSRLRESMAQAGISLGETSVSAESFREQAEHGSDSRGSRAGYRGDRDDAEPAWARTTISSGVRRGLVDLFA